MNKKTFTPIKINQLEISNRILMPAIHLNMCKGYEVTEPLIAFYKERAKGGAGIITVGFATIDEYSGNQSNIGAHSDEFIPGLTRLAKTIKENGSRAAIQLNHAGRYNHSAFMQGKVPVAPSSLPSRLTGETPEEISIERIKETIDQFGQAALRALRAGFDAVEILMGTGYLISEFLSPITNQRQDEYGGSLEKRMKFGLEIIQSVRKYVGRDYPLLVRINGKDLMPGGLSHKETLAWAMQLEANGVDALNINVGWHEARIPQVQSNVPRGAFSYLVRSIKDHVDIPVISGHRIHNTQTAEQLIQDGITDMVAMGRALIADPYMPQKAQSGKDQEIVHCIACSQGCFDHILTGRKSVECLCNPIAGHELEYNAAPTENPKKVMVIGGGAAGISAAVRASERGHQVKLFEKEDHLGGQLLLAAAPPGREEFFELAKDLENQITFSRVEVHLEQEVNTDLIQSEKPDTIILATGAIPAVPPIPGIEQEHVVQAWDILSGEKSPGQKVVIVGGGAVGVETALYLAEMGTVTAETLKFLLINKVESPEMLYQLATKGTREITLIEMLDSIGKDIGKTTRWVMMQELNRFGVEAVTESRVKAITPFGILVEKDGQELEIEANTVVLAAGSKPEQSLFTEVQNSGIEYHIIGDAGSIGQAFDAVHQGYETANQL